MLYTPARHEPLVDRPFDVAAAREAIAQIAAHAERDLAALDSVDLYGGAAGVAWALGELADEGYVASGPDRELVEALETRFDAAAGDEGVWWGVAGALAVAEHRWPDASRRDRLAERCLASLDLPSLEPMEGHPGYMALAAQLYARTGEERWAAIWAAGAERLLGEWRHDDELGAWLWTQQLGRHRVRYLGAAHGLVANVHVLRRGGAAERDEVDRRAVATLTRLAVVEDGRANWPTGAGGPLVANDRIRVQWCHGAAGVVTTMWDAAPDDAAWTALLVAAGELVWDAGPLRDAPGLCHGTAGNAYALLALWRRTADERWLDRARAFAQHAAAQVEERGRPEHSLFVGDEGVALCLASCIAADERFPLADRLI